MIIHVTGRLTGTRLDRLLVDRIDGLGTRGAWRLVSAGAVLVNGRHAVKGTRLSEGDEVRVSEGAIDAARSDFVPAAETDPGIRVLHRDERTLVVDKPQGMNTAPIRPEDRDTLVAAVLSLAPRMASVKGWHTREAGLVHRLDKGTSGVCLFAMDQDAFARLRTASESDLVVKDYVAAVHGRVLDGPSTLEATVSLENSRGPRVRITSVRRRKGKNLSPGIASAGQRILKMRLQILERRRHHTLVAVKLTRGFRHQVRSVLEAIGHPVVGDRVYGKTDTWPELLLHASRIVFPHPNDGRLVAVDSPDDRIRRALASL